MNIEIKHTNGPWKVEPDTEHPLYGHGIWTVEDVPIFVGRTAFAPSSYHNAKLISAAPELLKACIEVVNGYEGDGMENMGLRDEVFYRLCKQAINKATQP